MNKVKFYFILPLLSLVLFSCNDDDNNNSSIRPLKDYAEQYPLDLDSIENYLKTHSFKVVDVAGRIDVEIDTFIVGNTEGKVSIWDNTDYPLQFKMVKNDARASNLTNGQVADPVDYKLYYLMLNEGGGQASTKFDSTFVSYRGWRLDNKQFDISNIPFWATFPKITNAEVSVISGFRQFTTLLKTAESIVVGNNGVVNYNNYGVGVVFIPSALAYYNNSQNNVPSFSPLAFTIRLHSIRERDHDRDGVLSKYENGDGVVDLYTVDTDGDTIPDFLDIDDDNDNVRTILEVRNPATGKPFAYDQIPTCSGGTVKKHLDSSCQ
jgi:FKBP-type peptidyl-prolyl cis-trans isomerase FkpA